MSLRLSPTGSKGHLFPTVTEQVPGEIPRRGGVLVGGGALQIVLSQPSQGKSLGE